MTLKSGLAGSVGWGEESTWGLGVAPTLWLPALSESLKAEPDYIESAAVYSGRRFMTQDQVGVGAWKVSGDVPLEFTNKGMGLILKHALGTVNTTGPVNSLYTHTFTPGDLSGLGLTVQVGRPDSSTGTVHPWTYVGAKTSEWEFGAKVGENLTFTPTYLARQEVVQWTLTDGATTNGSNTVTSATGGFSESDLGKSISGTGIPAASFIGTVVDSNTVTLSSSSFTNTSVNASATGTGVTLTMGQALTSVSYASSILPMSFVSASVTIGGTAYKTTEVTLKGNNGLKDDRLFLGQNVIDEPLESDRREVTGTINGEYLSDVQYHRFLTGVPAQVVVRGARGTSTVTVTANVQFRGSTPTLDGTDVVKQELPFTVLGTTTDAGGLTIVTVNADATP